MSSPKNWDKVFINKLLEARDYRAFLHCFFDKDIKRKKPVVLTLQKFATKANFSSRSFIRDVILGKKRLTRRSLPKVIKGLSLNSTWARFFETLVFLEEEDLRNENLQEEQLAKRLKKLRMQLGLLDAPEDNQRAYTVLLNKNFPDIFAALGDESGATFEEIQSRTNLSERTVKNILSQMLRAKIIKLDTSHFIVTEQAIELVNLKDENLFKEDYLRALAKLRKRFKHQIKGDSLFVTQTFSVQKKKIKEFKSQLNQLVSDFADEAEDPLGDCIFEITLGATHSLGES